METQVFIFPEIYVDPMYTVMGLDLAIPKLIVMCGLQCSGKSTQAYNLAEREDAKVLSSDLLRLEYPGAKNETIFRLLYERANNLLEKGSNVIIDATNITIKSRRQIFYNIKFACTKICYIMNTPIEQCVERLLKRNNDPHYSNNVPMEVLDKYFKSFEVPFYEEGWDFIILHNNLKPMDIMRNKLSYRMVCDKFDQKNHHHKLTLQAHMDKVNEYLQTRTDNDVLIEAGMYHDIGKLFTQTLDDKGEAHYYQHHCVGAYKAICELGIVDNKMELETNKDKTLEFAFYINYHMHMYNIKTEKSKKRWQEIFGKDKFKYLVLLNEADIGGKDNGNN